MVGRAAGIGVMRLDLEPATVMKQPVKDVRRFMRRGRDDRDVVGAMLVGDMGIE